MAPSALQEATHALDKHSVDSRGYFPLGLYSLSAQRMPLETRPSSSRARPVAAAAFVQVPDGRRNRRVDGVEVRVEIEMLHLAAVGSIGRGAGAAGEVDTLLHLRARRPRVRRAARRPAAAAGTLGYRQSTEGWPQHSLKRAWHCDTCAEGRASLSRAAERCGAARQPCLGRARPDRARCRRRPCPRKAAGTARSARSRGS